MKRYLSRSIVVLSVVLSVLVVATPVLAGSPRASLKLMDASASLEQTSVTAWTLAKTGAVDQAASTVTWTVSATRGATTGGLLKLNGRMSVANTGTGSATIGNIVVNLQTKAGSLWVTRSSDVADATNGDAATTAKVVASASSEYKSSFTENAASGQLSFTDASTNTALSLVPQITIGAGQTRSLGFPASFDNNLLALPVGTPARAEVIVSFGNSAPGAGSIPNLDINGNGVIDADEAYVRSVPVRLGFTVPAQTPGDSTVTLTDTLADITTTGTVTFSNPAINLGATSGTVAVSYAAGTGGGTITNCAHLTGTGVALKTCNTQTIPAPPTCTPGRPRCGWQDGDMVTHNQTAWGASSTAAGTLLSTNFDAVYGLTDLVVGGLATMRFTSATAVFSYLPAAGSPGILTGNLQDPGSSSSGEFGGEVVALKINVDFSDAGLLADTTPLGDLRICNVSALPALNGQTVRQFLATANVILGGGTAAFGPDEASAVAGFVNNAFVNGSPSSFAQTNLVNGACPSWQDGDVVTYSQVPWGTNGSVPALLLSSQFFNVYPSGFVEIGLPGAAGFSARFTGPTSIASYLPAIGVFAPLDADLVDPGTTSSGAFGGEVLALTLNIDFSSLTGGSAGVAFGSLTLCNMSDSSLNSRTVSEFLGLLNTLLGGGSNGYAISSLAGISQDINAAFEGGSPSTFAKDHLVNGACP